MKTAEAVWYLAGRGNRPAGPFTTDQIVQSLQQGRLNGDTLCWQDGLPHWLPLKQTRLLAGNPRCPQPKAERTRPVARARGSFHVVRFALVAICLMAVSAGVYYLWSGFRALGRIEQLIACGDHDQAQRVASELAGRPLFDHEVRYLWALAEVEEYASADDMSSGKNVLLRPKRRLKAVINADEKWRRRAVSDYANILAHVPQEAPDFVPRSLAIARFLEDVQISDTNQLAGALLKMAGKQSLLLRSAPDASIEFLHQILTWDISLLDDFVALMFPEGMTRQNDLSASLMFLDRLADRGSDFAGPLASGLLQRAQRSAENRRYDLARLLLLKAEQMDSDLRIEVCSRLLEHVQQRLDKDDLASVVEDLNHVVRECPERLDDAARLFNECRKKPGDHIHSPAPHPQLMERANRLLEEAEQKELLQEAEVAIGEKRFDAAIEVLAKVRARDPDDEKAGGLLVIARCGKLVQEGTAALKKHNLEEARYKAEEALSLQPEDPDAQALLGEVKNQIVAQIQHLVEQDELLDALRVIDDALEHWPNDADIRNLLRGVSAAAEQWRIAGQHATALDVLRKVLELDPMNEETRERLAHSQAQVDKQELELLCGEAKKEMSSLQYVKAKEKAEQMRTTASEKLRNTKGPAKEIYQQLHETASELLGEIEVLQNDPRSTDLTGTWRAPTGERFRLACDGQNVSVNCIDTPPNIQSLRGRWERDGNRLDGAFDVVWVDPGQMGRPGENVARQSKIAVTATVQDGKTLHVRWKETRWEDRNRKQGHGFGYVDWTKESETVANHP